MAAFDQGWATGAGLVQQHIAGQDALRELQRHQAIATNQDAALNIASLIRTGKHPVIDGDPHSGRDLTPAEIMQLTQKHAELTAQAQDLWNPRQDPNRMGKSVSAAAGVAQPEGLLHKATDAIHLTKPPVSTDPTRTPSQVMHQLQDISQQYRTQPGQAEAQAHATQMQAKAQEIRNSGLSQDEQDEALRKLYGTTSANAKPLFKQYTLKDGTRAWLDASKPEQLPEGATASVTETSDTRTRNDYAAFQKENPAYKGTFEQWKAEQAGKGRQAGKPESFDQGYQAVLLKQQKGEPLTHDDKARIVAWRMWNQERNIDPGVARAAASGANRYVAVVDQNDPEKVVMMRAGDAAKAGAGTPQSIAFKTDAAITKYMTSGAGATNINYFNTATDHLKILREAGEALQNHDTQLFNSIGNRFATATGETAPTNFETVKAAVAGELSKTFKGTGATDSEIAEINTTINQAQSPEQINGAINMYTRLMGSKLGALKGQFDAGKAGKPNFSGSEGAPASGSDQKAPAGKGARSLKAAMALPVNQGKSQADVQKDLERRGYTVRP